MTSTESWVDIAEVAAHLQVTKDSIYRWVDSKGSLPTGWALPTGWDGSYVSGSLRWMSG